LQARLELELERLEPDDLERVLEQVELELELDEGSGPVPELEQLEPDDVQLEPEQDALEQAELAPEAEGYAVAAHLPHCDA
jgi:hypothetical protein